MVFPIAVGHCLPIHVDSYDNPELHDEEVKAILRRFPHKKISASRKIKRGG
jgi:hypothetical protein